MAKAYLLKNFVEMSTPLISGLFPLSAQNKYQSALLAIKEREGRLLHTEFCELMKEKRYTLGVFQEILKNLKKEGILVSAGKMYEVPGINPLFSYEQEVLRFCMENGGI